MSQTEIICACVLGVLGLLCLVFIVCFTGFLEYKAKRENINQLERIANACFGIEEGLKDIRRDLVVLQSIASDIDRIEVHENTFYDLTCDFYNNLIDEIKKVGE